MTTIEEVIKGLHGLATYATISIKGLVSSDGSICDTTLTLLPSDGYRDMQRQDYATLTEALAVGELSKEEETTAGVLITALEKALTPVDVDNQSTRGPAYSQEPDSPLYRLPSSPDAVYLLRLRREGEADHGKPPKGDIPLQKFLLTRKLRLKTASYVHAVKLQDGRFESLEVG
jgi:hypothetical protein